MNSNVFAALAMIGALGIAGPASAVTCYASVGGACVTKSYGSLDSTCTKPCNVAKEGGTAHIKSVQQALVAKGADIGPVDGVLGPKTRKALRAFQKEEKLPQTGRIDKQSLDRLGVKL